MKKENQKWMKWSLGLILCVFTFSSCTENKSDLGHFPKDADPVIIGTRLVNRFLEQPHSQYGNPLRINEPRVNITYPDVCAWVGGLWFAKSAGDKELTDKLEKRFLPLLAEESRLQPVPNHVDNNVFGALPLELYMQTGKEEYKKLGMMYADTQWQLPEEGYTPEQKKWADQGYSWQTRIWIDDMFMITAVQGAAYKATKDTTYATRAAREMVFYLDSIQQGNGLFYHSPEAPFCWGRGNGWMAVGMAELLRILPEDNTYRSEIMTRYLKMMSKLKECQNENGMWLQLVDDRSMWEETSGSAMFTYAMIVGVKKGWLGKEYAESVRKAWLSLVKYIDENGDMTNVCEGTNVGFTQKYYRDRLPLTGDTHGIAPMIWCAYALTCNDL